MDGVIVDSNPLHRLAWEEYNRSLGVETTEAMHQVMYGKRNDQLIRIFFGEHLTDDEVFAHGAAKEALYRDMLRPRLEETLVPGVRAFLARYAGLPSAIATNAEPANAELVLAEAGLQPFFRLTVTGHEVSRPKPDPEIYLRAAELLGIPPAACLVFEDSYAGVEAGLAAGMAVVGISTTHSELPGVSLLVPDFNDPALEAWMSRRAYI